MASGAGASSRGAAARRDHRVPADHPLSRRSGVRPALPGFRERQPPGDDRLYVRAGSRDALAMGGPGAS